MNQGSHHIQLPVLSFINKVLIIVNVAVFLLLSLMGDLGSSVARFLSLTPGLFFSGHIYELVTYSFISTGLLATVFNSIILWFIGSELESMWGRRRYLTFIIVIMLGSGLLYLFTALFVAYVIGNPIALVQPWGGLHGVNGALLLTYAIIYPDRIFAFMAIFPMKAKYFCAILIAMLIYMGVSSAGGMSALGQLGSMLVAFLYMLTVTSPTFKSFMNGQGGGGGNPLSIFGSKSKKRGRGNLKLVSSDDEDPPKYWH
jgi:membrane associated rhomboid family serine protease